MLRKYVQCYNHAYAYIWRHMHQTDVQMLVILIYLNFVMWMENNLPYQMPIV